MLHPLSLAVRGDNGKEGKGRGEGGRKESSGLLEKIYLLYSSENVLMRCRSHVFAFGVRQTVCSFHV
jgi:hypothetical protein